jgi:hypothetical protein
MVMLPVRAVCAVFAATVKAFDPLPLPLTGGVTVIHGTPLVAVQVQPPFVVIATLPEPPAAGIEADVGRSEMAQGAGALTPSWTTAISSPPTVIVPLRAAPTFCAMVTPSVAAPEPEAGAVRTIQPALVEAVHAHPPGVVTVIVAAPPEEVKWPSLIAA